MHGDRWKTSDNDIARESRIELGKKKNRDEIDVRCRKAKAGNGPRDQPTKDYIH